MAQTTKKGSSLLERWRDDDEPFKIIEEPEEEAKKSDFTIYKADNDRRLVFGWASISITADGEQLEDRQKDMIDPEDLEEAVYDYVLKFRDTGEEHIPTMRKKGKLVESCVLTAEKQKAMGIPEGTLPIGWWIGFKIEDDDAWARVKNGTYKMFSIEGKANREPVEKAEPVAKTFDEILKFNPYHGADGRFSNANAATSFTYSPGKSKAHDLAIQREKERMAAAGGTKEESGTTSVTSMVQEYKRNNPNKGVPTMYGGTKEQVQEYYRAINSTYKYPEEVKSYMEGNLYKVTHTDKANQNGNYHANVSVGSHMGKIAYPGGKNPAESKQIQEGAVKQLTLTMYDKYVKTIDWSQT